MSEINHKHGDIPRTGIIEIAAGQTFTKGDMVAQNAAGLAVQADDAAAIFVIGIACDGGAAGESIQWESGVFAMGAGSAAPAAGDLRQVVYAQDHELVSTDRDFTPAGILVGFDSDGDPLVFMSPLTEGMTGPAAWKQQGQATLVAGTVDVDTTIRLNASSKILLQAEGLSGSTNFAYLDVTARTDGDIGTASFTISALTAAHAADTDAVGDVNWAILD